MNIMFFVVFGICWVIMSLYVCVSWLLGWLCNLVVDDSCCVCKVGCSNVIGWWFSVRLVV